jgi:hypothetical protein
MAKTILALLLWIECAGILGIVAWMCWYHRRVMWK